MDSVEPMIINEPAVSLTTGAVPLPMSDQHQLRMSLEDMIARSCQSIVQMNLAKKSAYSIVTAAGGIIT
jgi:hypothetical protein